MSEEIESLPVAQIKRIAELERELARVKEHRRIFCNEVLARDRLVAELEREVKDYAWCKQTLANRDKHIVDQNNEIVSLKIEHEALKHHNAKLVEESQTLKESLSFVNHQKLLIELDFRNRLIAKKDEALEAAKATLDLIDSTYERLLVEQINDALSLTPDNILDEVKKEKDLSEERRKMLEYFVYCLDNHAMTISGLNTTLLRSLARKDGGV